MVHSTGLVHRTLATSTTSLGLGGLRCRAEEEEVDTDERLVSGFVFPSVLHRIPIFTLLPFLRSLRNLPDRIESRMGLQIRRTWIREGVFLGGCVPGPVFVTNRHDFGGEQDTYLWRSLLWRLFAGIVRVDRDRLRSWVTDSFVPLPRLLKSVFWLRAPDQDCDEWVVSAWILLWRLECLEVTGVDMLPLLLWMECSNQT